MNSVKPLIYKHELEMVCSRLRDKHPRYELLFRLGCETGYRVSDLLGVRYKDIANGYLGLREAKTKKRRSVPISGETMLLVVRYATNYGVLPEEFLFFSSSKNKTKHVSREQAYRVINVVSKACGFEGIGTHSMRKTYAVNEYRGHKDIEKLRENLNHKYSGTTVRYILDALEIRE